MFRCTTGYPLKRLLSPALGMLLAVLALPAVAFADAPPRPASFDHESRALASLIVFPELRGDAKATINCVAIAKRDGDFEDAGCYEQQPSDQVFIAAIVRATRKAKVNPALFDGRPRAVYLQYRVTMERKGEENTVTIHNNPGLLENIEAYGEDHVAAQRALTKERWQKACPQHVRFLVWAKAHVDETGRQSSISIQRGEGSPPITDTCRDAIVATLEESRFTPAYADGEPVPSSFIEPFGN